GLDAGLRGRWGDGRVSRLTFTVTGASRRGHARPRYTCQMAVGSDKTFYIETFGCQMNAHDSEKVIGTLISEGYAQVSTVEEAGLVLYNTCSIRDKAEQK